MNINTHFWKIFQIFWPVIYRKCEKKNFKLIFFTFPIGNTQKYAKHLEDSISWNKNPLEFQLIYEFSGFGLDSRTSEMESHTKIRFYVTVSAEKISELYSKKWNLSDVVATYGSPIEKWSIYYFITCAIGQSNSVIGIK